MTVDDDDDDDDDDVDDDEDDATCICGPSIGARDVNGGLRKNGKA